MQLNKLTGNMLRSVTFCVITGLFLASIDALDVLLRKAILFNSAAQAGFFLLLALGISIIFSSVIGIAEGLFISFAEKKPVIVIQAILTILGALLLGAGLEYGTFFHRPRIIAILAVAVLLGCPLGGFVLRELYSIKEGGLIRNRLPKIFVCVAAFLLLYWINSRLFFNQNFFLHLIMAFALFFLTQLMLIYIFRKRILRMDFVPGIPAGIIGVLLACAVFFSFFGFDLSQNVKRLSFEQTSIERFMLYTLKRIFDFDMDKYTVVFGGGDPDDFNSRVNPQAQEIPDNGIDENGFCGDYKSAGSPAYAKAGAFPDKPAPDMGYNLIILIVDAMRPDHMGCYGYSRNTTPFIDTLAKDAFIFSHAYAQACHTRTSLPSFMLSQYQPFAGKKWKHEGSTMAEIFKEKGYYTASVIFYNLGDVFMRGYDEFYSPDTSPEEWNRKDPFIPVALEMIDKADGNKFFLWMHLPYPHHPYSLHSGITDFGSSNIDRYDNEILYTDGLISNFYKELRKRALVDKTIFVILADHGEEFGEHGGEYHNSTAYNEQIRVPLLIVIPDRKGFAVRDNVMLVDLSATILYLCGIEKPGYYQGRNFAALIAGKKNGWDNRAVSGPIGSFQRFAAVDGSWKAVFNMRNNTYELYDLNRDFREQHNLIDVPEYRNSQGRDLIKYLHEMIEENNLNDQLKTK